MENKRIEIMPMPHGRFLYERPDGKYEVQPQNDNYWVVSDTIEETLAKAGWKTEENDEGLKEYEVPIIYQIHGKIKVLASSPGEASDKAFEVFIHDIDQDSNYVEGSFEVDDYFFDQFDEEEVT